MLSLALEKLSFFTVLNGNNCWLFLEKESISFTLGVSNCSLKL